jgi:hypothetical protein
MLLVGLLDFAVWLWAELLDVAVKAELVEVIMLPWGLICCGLMTCPEDLMLL